MFVRMDSENDKADSVQRLDALADSLALALERADALDLAIVGIRISEAIDALNMIRAD